MLLFQTTGARVQMYEVAGKCILPSQDERLERGKTRVTTQHDTHYTHSWKNKQLMKEKGCLHGTFNKDVRLNERTEKVIG